jgi:nitrogen regulatory protein P-II 2
MALKQRKLITIVIEAALEARLTKDITSLGAKGYTVTRAHGLGPRNQRNGDLEGGNIRLETVVHADLVEGITNLLETKYFPHYACSCWISSVDVVRDERY